MDKTKLSVTNIDLINPRREADVPDLRLDVELDDGGDSVKFTIEASWDYGVGILEANARCEEQEHEHLCWFVARWATNDFAVHKMVNAKVRAQDEIESSPDEP